MSSSFYSQPVEEGKGIEEFAWRCGAAFFHDTYTVPTKATSDGYYKKKLKESIRELAKFQKIPFKTALKLKKKEEAAAKKSYDEYTAACKVSRDRAEAMTEQVNDWQCPVVLEGLKKLMLNQLKDMVEHNTPYDFQSATKTLDQWLVEKIRWLKRDISLGKKRVADERNQVIVQNQMIQTLEEQFPR